MKTMTTFRVLMTMKNLRAVLAILFAIMTGYATPASAISEEVKQRVQKDLKNNCLQLFLSGKFELFSSVHGYQYYSSPMIMQHAVFAVGDVNSEQHCGWAYGAAWQSLGDIEQKAIKQCEGSFYEGLRCEIYAHKNNIVYADVHEKLKTAKKLLEAGDSSAKPAIAEVGEKLVTLTSVERGEYEYLFGKILANFGTEQDRNLVIEHFNKAWSKYGNVSSAVEEGNLRMAAGDFDKNWLPIRDAYQYFLAKASDEQKALHPEVEQNLKQTESYYQADLVQREAAAKALEIEQQKQAKIDAIEAKRTAEQQAKQERLDAIKAAQEMRQQEEFRLAEAKRIAIEGDGSDDDKTCKSYGARPGADGYVNCRIQLSHKKQLADDKEAAQKNSEAAAQRDKLAADFENNKRCVNETKNPVCYNNAGVALFYMGNKRSAQEWFTEAARYGEPNAITNLSRNGWPVPQPDLLRAQQQATGQSNDGALLLLMGVMTGAAAYQQGKAAGYRSTPTPSYTPPPPLYTPPPPPVNCITRAIGDSLKTTCQ